MKSKINYVTLGVNIFCVSVFLIHLFLMRNFYGTSNTPSFGFLFFAFFNPFSLLAYLFLSLVAAWFLIILSFFKKQYYGLFWLNLIMGVINIPLFIFGVLLLGMG